MTNFKKWIAAAGVRALKTVAQTAEATISTSAIMSEVNWPVVASASLLAGILSLLTSIAGLPELEMYEDEEEAFEAYLKNEGTLQENYDYYFGDDEVPSHYDDDDDEYIMF